MINYEQEVKKVYPDSFVFYMGNGYQVFNGIITHHTSMSVLCDTTFLAWQSAYEQLKKEGKIHNSDTTFIKPPTDDSVYGC